MRRGNLLFIVVGGVALACLMTYITSLIWPPPAPFFW
jgi:hypothetical protein